MLGRLDLLILGDVNPDLVLTGDVVPAFGQAEQLLDAATLTVGGSGAITACAAARLGLTVAICGVVGDDLFGRFMREELDAHGVDTGGLRTDPDVATGLTVVLSRSGDRASLTWPGAIASLDAASLDLDLVASARHVHVSQYFMQDALRPGLPELIAHAHASGATVSIDPNADPAGRWDDGLLDLLPSLDVFLPNAAEAIAIARADDVGAAAAGLPSKLVVVKDGPHGAVAVRDGTLIHAPAFAVEAVDATGAGDTFDAGFLAALLEGRPIEEALRFANACAALSTRGLGGVEAQPTREETEALAAQAVP